jgi:tetratricopeptide (TPR) repeat protein
MKDALVTFSKLALTLFLLAALAANMSGCSPAGDGMLQITPQQYFYSAKEQLETIDERAYEIRDLDEIIRVLENAEKDATKSEIIDKSRLYLCLANTLKARKQYQNSLMKGEYVANRAAPFYIVNTKDVKETLRDAKKWLRMCNAQFKTSVLIPDLNYVTGMYYLQKVLTQHSSEKRESLDIAVESLRRCLGMAPDYQSDFRLFGKVQTTREVRLKLVELLAIGNQQEEAYALLSEFSFAPISPVAGSTSYEDFSWHKMNGFVLATMGKYEEAAAALERFKIIAPQDYPQVDEALWYLEGVYDKLYEITKEERWELEARIVAALQKKLKGPFSEEQYATAAHLYPRVLPGDADFYTAVIDYYAGKFSQALNRLTKLKNRGLMASHNRISADLLWVEASMYSGSKASDDVIEELLRISQKHSLTPLQKERAGFLLARYLMNEDDEFETNRVNHEGQTFVKSIIGKPWALNLTYKRGEIMRAKTPLRLRSKEDEEKSKRGPGRLIGELYANRSNDWIVSANLYLFSLPDLSLPGKGRIVGRENENEGWIFKDAQIDALKRRQQYLAVFEFDNSDSEKSIQGTLFTPK